MQIKAALMQFDVVLGNKEENYSKIRKLAEKLPADCDYLVLPELWNVGYDKEGMEALAETLKGKSVSFLKKLAKAKNVNIIGGSIIEKKDNTFYNTAVVINRNGELIGNYRKVHLFPYELKEDEMFEPGNEWSILENEGLRFGMMICYDLRFPAFCRNLALRDVSVVFVPAQWPQARIEHFRILMKARAVENQIFIIGVNRCGNDITRFGGHSMAISPDGVVLGECGTEEEILTVTFQSDQNDYFHKIIPVFGDRVNILDEIDNTLI